MSKQLTMRLTTSGGRRVVTAACVMLGLVSAALPTRAQTLADLPAGARVRIDAAGFAMGGLTWRFIRLSSDSLIVSLGNEEPFAIPKWALTKVEVSRGVSRVHGAFVGAAIGGLGGLIVGGIVASAPEGFPVGSGGGGDPHAAKHFAQAAVPILVAGTAIGALIGKEQWARVQLPMTVTLGALTMAPRTSPSR